MGYSDISQIFRDLHDVSKKINDAALNDKMMELSEKTFDLLDENESLKNKVKELEQVIKNESKLKMQNGAYFNIEDDNGPICPRCWEVDNIMVHLQEGVVGMHNSYPTVCPNCDAGYIKVHVEDRYKE